ATRGGGCPGSAHLRQPVLEVVVVAHPRDAAVADPEEGAAGQLVALSARGRKAVVGREVFAVHHVLGGGARAVGGGHHHHVAQLLAIAAVHAGHERGEGLAAVLARALVEVVDHVVGEQGQHAFAVAAVERGVVGQHQFGGTVVEAAAVDAHGSSPGAPAVGGRAAIIACRARPTAEAPPGRGGRSTPRAPGTPSACGRNGSGCAAWASRRRGCRAGGTGAGRAPCAAGR